MGLLEPATPAQIGLVSRNAVEVGRVGEGRARADPPLQIVRGPGHARETLQHSVCALNGRPKAAGAGAPAACLTVLRPRPVAPARRPEHQGRNCCTGHNRGRDVHREDGAAADQQLYVCAPYMGRRRGRRLRAPDVIRGAMPGWLLAGACAMVCTHQLFFRMSTAAVSLAAKPEEDGGT